MNEFYPIPTQYAQANQSDVMRDLLRFLKNPIGAKLSLLEPPDAFEHASLIGNDLHWTLGAVTQDTYLVVTATWTVDDSTETAQAILHFKVLETEADIDFLEWFQISPLYMFADADGNVTGTLIEGVDDWINNPSGAEVTYAIASKSSSITSATLNTANDISIAATGLTGNILTAYVTIQASATIDGELRTVEQQIDVRLIYQAIDLSNYVTNNDIKNFITNGDLPDTSGFITSGDLPDTSGFITSGAIANFITSGAISAFITSGDIPDTSRFITSGDIPDTSGFITSGAIANFITTGAISAFITSGSDRKLYHKRSNRKLHYEWRCAGHQWRYFRIYHERRNRKLRYFWGNRKLYHKRRNR